MIRPYRRARSAEGPAASVDSIRTSRRRSWLFGGSTLATTNSALIAFFAAWWASPHATLGATSASATLWRAAKRSSTAQRSQRLDCVSAASPWPFMDRDAFAPRDPD